MFSIFLTFLNFADIEDNTDAIDSKNPYTFEVIKDADITNRHLFNVHKIIFDSISKIKKIKQKQPMLITDGSYACVYETGSPFLVLLNYLKENQIKTLVRKKGEDNAISLDEFVSRKELKLEIKGEAKDEKMQNY